MRTFGREALVSSQASSASLIHLHLLLFSSPQFHDSIGPSDATAGRRIKNQMMNNHLHHAPMLLTDHMNHWRGAESVQVQRTKTVHRPFAANALPSCAITGENESQIKCFSYQASDKGFHGHAEHVMACSRRYMQRLTGLADCHPSSGDLEKDGEGTDGQHLVVGDLQRIRGKSDAPLRQVPRWRIIPTANVAPDDGM